MLHLWVAGVQYLLKSNCAEVYRSTCRSLFQRLFVDIDLFTIYLSTPSPSLSLLPSLPPSLGLHSQFLRPAYKQSRIHYKGHVTTAVSHHPLHRTSLAFESFSYESPLAKDTMNRTNFPFFLFVSVTALSGAVMDSDRCTGSVCPFGSLYRQRFTTGSVNRCRCCAGCCTVSLCVCV